jgi:glycosyltransferase involved in cell wall biosynthesis
MDETRTRVGFVIDDLGHGGAQRQMSLIAPALSRYDAGLEASVFCTSDVTEPYATSLRDAGVPVEHYPSRSSFDPSRLLSLRRGLRAQRVDVVHSFLDASNIYGYLAARTTGLPVAVSLRSDRLIVAGVRARILGAVMRRADLVTVNSVAGRRTVVARMRVDEDRVCVVRNCVADGAFVPAQAHAGRIVGFVGRLVALKRVDRLVDAFALVAKRSSDAQLVLVGDGPEREALARRTAETGLGERVTFAGAVDDVGPLLRRFACLVLPSEFEGLPNAVLEAMAAGIPVVVRPVGDLPEIVHDGRTGVLVSDDTAASLAGAISRALEDAGLRDTAREEGPLYVRRHFSERAAVEALAAQYRRLLRAR